MPLTKPVRPKKDFERITALHIKPPEVKQPTKENEKPTFFVRYVSESHKEIKAPCTPAMYLYSMHGNTRSTKVRQGTRKRNKGLDQEIGKMFVLHRNMSSGLIESIDMLINESFSHSIVPEGSEDIEVVSLDIDDLGNVNVTSKPLSVRTQSLIRLLQDLGDVGAIERDQTIGNFVVDDVKGKTVTLIPGENEGKEFGDPYAGAVNLAYMHNSAN